MDSNEIATTKVKSQLAKPARDMARGRGPCRNSSAPIIVGIGPATTVRASSQNEMVPELFAEKKSLGTSVEFREQKTLTYPNRRRRKQHTAKRILR